MERRGEESKDGSQGAVVYVRYSDNLGVILIELSLSLRFTFCGGADGGLAAFWGSYLRSERSRGRRNRRDGHHGNSRI